MDSRDLTDYGGPKVDAKPVQNPESELTAAEYNRSGTDLAQLTCCKAQAVVRFDTTAAAAPVIYAAANVQHRSLWGNGTAQKPTVTKTATGRYTIAYPATFTDVLGTVETLNFLGAHVEIVSSTAGDVVQGRPLTVTSSGGTFVVHSPHGTDADVGDVGAAVLTVVVTFY